MINQADFFEEDIPSRHVELLSQMKGRTIQQLRRLTTYNPEEGLEKFHIPNHMIFLDALGSLVLDFDENLRACFFLRLNTRVLTVVGLRKKDGIIKPDLDIENDPECYLVDCDDPEYSNKQCANFVGKKIKDVKILKAKNLPIVNWMGPVESGISLVMEDDTELIIAFRYIENRPGTIPLTRDMIPPEVLKTLEEIEV